MHAICLSQAPILRCQSLTEVESGVLLIPPGLELVFCIGLVVLRGCDRKHVFLTTEGFTYCGLALLDLLAHVIPAASARLGVFKPLDILTGALSSIPLLLYSSFLYTFTASQFIPSLPRQQRLLARHILIFFIPVIVVANGIGSFLTLSYRFIGNSLLVGFTDEAIHLGFDSLTLSVLVIYQLLNFGLAANRLARAVRYRQDLALEEKSNHSEYKAQTFRGSPWLVVGMLLGALETILGFPGGGFALAFVRRVLRMLGRACLIVGAFNGVDTIEDFHILKSEAVQQRRRSKLLGLIGNPRNSTFRQLEGYIYDPTTGGLRPKQSQLSMMASNALDEIRTISIRLGPSPRSSVRPTDMSLQGSSGRGTSAPGSSVEAVVHTRVRTPPLNVIALPASGAVPFPAVRLRDPPRRAARPQERVTVHWGDSLAAPHLELRRVSDLLDENSWTHLTQLGIDPYGDVHPHLGVFRAISLPTHVAMEQWATAQGDHPSLRRFSDEARSKHRSSPAYSSVSPSGTGYSQSIEEAEAFASLGRQDSVLSLPSSAIIAPVVRRARTLARHTYGGGQAQEAHRRGSSYASSLELLQVLASQFPGTPSAVSQSSSQRAIQGSHHPSASQSSGEMVLMALGDASLARADSWEARTLPSHSRAPSKDLLAMTPQTIQEEGEPRMSEDSTLIGHSSHKKQMSTDSQVAAVAAGLPTPTSMRIGLPTPPMSASQEDMQAKIRERARKSATPSANPHPPPPVRMDSVDSTDLQDVPPARPRIKSVGIAPRRYTPTPTNSSIYTRESVAVELDEVGEPMDVRRRSRKLSKRSKRNSRASRKERKSMVAEVDVAPVPITTVDPTDRSVFED